MKSMTFGWGYSCWERYKHMYIQHTETRANSGLTAQKHNPLKIKIINYYSILKYKTKKERYRKRKINAFSRNVGGRGGGGGGGRMQREKKMISNDLYFSSSSTVSWLHLTETENTERQSIQNDTAQNNACVPAPPPQSFWWWWVDA